jgi:hypothetical protein
VQTVQEKAELGGIRLPDGRIERWSGSPRADVEA